VRRYLRVSLGLSLGFVLLLIVAIFWFKQASPPLVVAGQRIRPSLTFNVGPSESRPSKCRDQIPSVKLPKSALHAAELALIVNDQDPQSIAVAAAYQKRRDIPIANVVHLSFPAGQKHLSPTEFKPLKSKVDAALNNNIQAMALSFSLPYRVGCMSVTSAFGLGYDKGFCQQPAAPPGCRRPRLSRYFNADSVAPWTDLGIRPTMMLAGENTETAIAVIERGLRAEGSFPEAMGYLVSTTDAARNSRSAAFEKLAWDWPNSNGWQLEHIDNRGAQVGSDALRDRSDVLFYFTGLTQVPDINTNRYLPGAIADHLTSFGGVLSDSGQMSVLEWLQAGVTASYGTVIEPCNFPEKFPDPAILVPSYFRGQTAVEAYWKSVASPQEGLFVGDPLAKPMGVKHSVQNNRLNLALSILEPGEPYQVFGAGSTSGDYQPIGDRIRLSSDRVVNFSFGCEQPYYKLEKVGKSEGKKQRAEG
jgi:uncharacterized protein (TIGR03790 family)